MCIRDRSISLLGMLIPFIGIGDKTAVVALTIYGIMPMVRNTYAGIKGVDEDIITAARGMGSTDFQIMTKIKLPLALGVITVSYTHLAEVLILGAFGCGAFCNPPQVVANVFKQVQQDYLHVFDTIEYAVFHTERETENYSCLLYTSRCV